MRHCAMGNWNDGLFIASDVLFSLALDPMTILPASPARAHSAGVMPCEALWRIRPGFAGAIAPAILVFALSAGACNSNAPAPRRTVRVPIRGFEYTPSALTVQAGDTVAWTNDDIVPHTATTADGSVNSGAIGPNATWSYVASQKGSFSYHCTFHPSMQGTLRVE